MKSLEEPFGARGRRKKSMSQELLENIKASAVDEIHTLLKSSPLILGQGAGEFSKLRDQDIRTYQERKEQAYVLWQIYTEVVDKAVLKTRTESADGGVRYKIDHNSPRRSQLVEQVARRRFTSDKETRDEIYNRLAANSPEFGRQFPGENGRESFDQLIEAATSVAMFGGRDIKLDAD